MFVLCGQQDYDMKKTVLAAYWRIYMLNGIYIESNLLKFEFIHRRSRFDGTQITCKNQETSITCFASGRFGEVYYTRPAAQPLAVDGVRWAHGVVLGIHGHQKLWQSPRMHWFRLPVRRVASKRRHHSAGGGHWCGYVCNRSWRKAVLGVDQSAESSRSELDTALPKQKLVFGLEVVRSRKDQNVCALWYSHGTFLCPSMATLTRWEEKMGFRSIVPAKGLRDLFSRASIITEQTCHWWGHCYQAHKESSFIIFPSCKVPMP